MRGISKLEQTQWQNAWGLGSKRVQKVANKWQMTNVKQRLINRTSLNEIHECFCPIINGRLLCLGC